ncbi:MAG: nucleotide exchange factor GrpE [Alkalibacterium sp.]|nr:nucleotide exchange factor GrpE [Alkalibacterium sp.]
MSHSILTYHEAYTQVPANEGQESNEVGQVFEKGYKLHDRVLARCKSICNTIK